MFCTDKERQTCDVEKRGCEGCYYNGMSEEEIKKILLCENIGELAYCGLLDKLDERNNNDLNELKKQALKGLLDLYNQEKEERRKAAHNFDEITIKMAKLDTELQQEKEKNKKAYIKANNYLYFDDSSDYGVALWEVIRSLRPDLAERWDNGETADLKYIEE